MVEIEQLVQWLTDSGEVEAAGLAQQCSLKWIWATLVSELGGDRDWDLWDVYIEAPAKVLKLVRTDQSSFDKTIEGTLRELAEAGGSDSVRGVHWVPKPAPTQTGAELKITAQLDVVDSEHVKRAWSRALERRSTDPEGAITAARSLIESVCKHILESFQIPYDNHADLPRLYYLVAASLKLAPSRQTGDPLKKVLGSCQSVVDGVAALRNEFGDAHGKGACTGTPSPPLAELAINLAGACSAFLVSTWERSKEQSENRLSRSG